MSASDRPDVGPSERIASAALASDLVLLRRALEAVHPGLYRYNTREQMAAHFTTLAAAFGRDLTRQEAFLALSQFTAKIRCGHTFPNPHNQSEAVAAELFARQDKLPFYFRWIDGRMIVTRDFTEDKRLKPGTEILGIDGWPARTVLERLMTIARADGSNDAKRVSLIEKEIPVSLNQRFVRYIKAPPDLDGVLDTWDPSFRDWNKDAVGPLDLADRNPGLPPGTTDGFYFLRSEDPGSSPDTTEMMQPRGRRYQGRVFVLTDASNSSATFYFAQMVKTHKLGTLVGQPTGGNQRGINGGAFFFVRLPKTGLEVDLPIIGNYPRRGSAARDDAGIVPDALVLSTVEEIAGGVDAEMREVQRLIAAANQGPVGLVGARGPFEGAPGSSGR